MESARRHRTNWLEPRPHSKAPGRWVLSAFLLVLLAAPFVPAAVARLGPEQQALVNVALVPSLLCGIWLLWMIHLLVKQTGRFAAVLLTLLLASQTIAGIGHMPSESLHDWLVALGNALFVYALLWVFRMHEEESGLQAIASAALVLSIGMLAKPAVLVLCALFSAVSFFKDRCLAGSAGKFLLLLFTPALLCLISLVLLSFLYYGSLAGLHWFRVGPLPPSTTATFPLVALWPLVWATGVVLGRLFAARSGRPDLAYLCLLVFLPVLGSLHRLPDPITPLDMGAIITLGAACLLAAGGRLSWQEWFCVLTGLAGAGLLLAPPWLWAAAGVPWLPAWLAEQASRYYVPTEFSWPVMLGG